MMVFIIGLSGAGKATLANAVASMTRFVRQNMVSLDGDVRYGDLCNNLRNAMKGIAR